MRKCFGLLLSALCLGVLSTACPSYCQLSQNSGINSSDTWVPADLTIVGNTQVSQRLATDSNRLRFNDFNQVGN